MGCVLIISPLWNLIQKHTEEVEGGGNVMNMNLEFVVFVTREGSYVAIRPWSRSSAKCDRMFENCLF